MTKEFKVHMSGSSRLLVRISGPITELADMSGIRITPRQAVEVDLIHMTTINSSGIRTFRDWIGSLVNETIVLSYCPKVFIDQVNMVFNFLPTNVKITSFYVPYFCEESSEETNFLFRAGQEYAREGDDVKITWPRVLDSAGNEMKIDVNVAKYFVFLKTHG
jgi:hypothetical protein